MLAAEEEVVVEVAEVLVHKISNIVGSSLKRTLKTLFACFQQWHCPAAAAAAAAAAVLLRH